MNVPPSNNSLLAMDKDTNVSENGKVPFDEILDEVMAASDEHERQKNNPFPVDAFPFPFKELICEGKKSLNFPPEYMGTSILSAISTTIGKSGKLKVKAGWYEYPATFFSLVGNAGASKSHPLDMAYSPLKEIDRRTIRAFAREHEAFEEFQSLSKKEKADVQAIEKPTLVKTILTNFTPEILFQRLQDNDRGCVVLSEELATWIEGMNNYSKGDQASTYLSIWSNKGTSIDRVSKPVPLWISDPFLNIIGTLQLRRLKSIFPAAKSDMGLLQRFLFSVIMDGKSSLLMTRK